MKTIFIGADHAGFALKGKLCEWLAKEMPNVSVKDVGCFDEKSVDYPDIAESVGTAVAKGQGQGILVCGSGIGVAISANKIDGIRAAQVWDVTSARLSREHNDANICCIGSRLTGPEVAIDIVKIWLNTSFLGGRHAGRVEKIKGLEKK